MRRATLTDAQWERLRPLLPPQKPRTGRPAKDHRLILDGILWIARTGAPWRDLPPRFGPWQTVATRFYRWHAAGIWDALLAALQRHADATGQLDWGVHFVDVTTIRAHQHAAGARGSDPEAEALGRGRGGFSTKVRLRTLGHDLRYACGQLLWPMISPPVKSDDEAWCRFWARTARIHRPTTVPLWVPQALAERAPP